MNLPQDKLKYLPALLLLLTSCDPASVEKISTNDNNDSSVTTSSSGSKSGSSISNTGRNNHQGTYQVDIDTSKNQFTVSPKIVGMHFVYSGDKDEIYKDGKYAKWAASNNISYARYPGGSVVKYWNWEKPNGIKKHDDWGKNKCSSKGLDTSLHKDPKDWMSLDEFIDFVKKSGVKPTFGVNDYSAPKYGCFKESIDRAVRMVKYVKSKGFAGSDWYIGNEEEFEFGGVKKYATRFAAHAKAMKKVDPNIKIFFNMNNPNKKTLRTFLQNDEGTADGLETHGKWPYGGNPDMNPGTLTQWRTEFPMRDRKNGFVKNGGRRWRLAADKYRRTISKVAPGRKILISNNEYGIGKEHNIIGFDRYTKGLLGTEMLAEHIIGNWYTTAYWSNILGQDTQSKFSDERGVFSFLKKNDYYETIYQKNPIATGMSILSNAQGGKFLESFHVDNWLFGFAVKHIYKSRPNTVTVFVINKSVHGEELRFNLKGFKNVDTIFSSSMIRGKKGYSKTKVNKVERSRDGTFFIKLNEESYTMITFTAKK